MAITTNGITAEVIRDAMPPYQLSSDLLAAMFAAVPAPPPDATAAWRLERATRLIHEMAGLVPADAPQARIAAQIVIAREATDATFAWANGPGVTVDQACRLRRTAGALMNSTVALERTLARHQQRPVPFFGTVLDDAIDVPALAAGWGKPGSRRDEAGAAGCGMATDRSVTLVTAGSAARDNGPVTGVRGGPRPAATMELGPNDAAAAVGGFRSVDRPVTGGMAATDGVVAREGRLAMPTATALETSPGTVRTRTGVPAPTTVPASAPTNVPATTYAPTTATAPALVAASATERHGPPRPRPDAEATCGVVTRLDQGPGWTLDVVRPRAEGDVVRPRAEGDVVRPRAEGDVVRPRAAGDVVGRARRAMS